MKLEERVNELEKALVELEKKVEVIGQAVSELIKERKEKKEKAYESVIYGFKTFEDYENFVRICREIMEKDMSFDFEERGKTIAIFSDNKDELHKRSLWLVKKTGIEDLKYTVKERR